MSRPGNSWHITYYQWHNSLGKRFFISKKAQFFSTLSWLNVWFQLCHPPLWFGGVCMADGISELWRVGWRPSAPSITQWWTWEANPWQLGGCAEVGGTNGVKDRAREGSQLPQYGDCKNKGLGKEGGGVDGEKCPGLRSGIYDGGIRWTMPSLAVCLCEGWGWISWLFVHILSAVWIIKGAFHHVAVIFCFCTSILQRRTRKTTLPLFLQFSRWCLC